MSGRHRARTPKSSLIVGSITASVGISSVLSAVIVEFVAPAPASPPTGAAPQVAEQQSLTQQGRLIAVSPESITTQGVDGSTQTFLVTPDTTAVHGAGGQTGVAAASFAVNDEVAVVGTRHGNTVIATAIADRSATGAAGPPMDFGI